MFKNTASQKIRVFAFADAGHATLDAGEPVTGDAANITAQTAVDNAALGASNDVNPAEVDATNAPGYYEFDPTQAETNGDVIEWYAKSSTAGVQVVTVGGAVINTRPTNWANLETSLDNYSATRGLSGTALPAAAADAAGGLPISDAGGLDLDNRMLGATAVTNANTVFDTDFATNYDAANNYWYSRLANAAQGGSSAVLTLERLVIASTTAGQPGVSITGNTTGAGVAIVGGANADGMTVTSGASGAAGMTVKGNNVSGSHGLVCVGARASVGIAANEGSGIYATGVGGAANAGFLATSPSGGADILADITGNLSGSVGSVTGAINTAAGTITTLDALDTAQDAQHAVTQTGQPAIKYMGPYGAGIYYDDGAGNTNTTIGTDGTVSNPVSSLAAATTLATSLGVNRIYIGGQSTLTLTGQTLTDYDIVGVETADAATVNLGTNASQSVLTRVRIINCTVYGEHDASDRLDLEGCFIADAPAAEVTYLHVFARNCGFVSDFTLDASADNLFKDCYSAKPSNGYPSIAATGASGTAVFDGYRGRIEFASLGASHVFTIHGTGIVQFAADCNVNAAVTISGNMAVSDLTAGMANLTESARVARDTINAEADTALTDYDPPTRAELTTDTNSILAILGTPAGADMSADIASVKTDTTAIIADTNELQTDWADGGRLDLIVDAILVDTGTTLPAAIPTANTVADAVLARDVTNVEDTAAKHSLAAVIMIGTNSSISGTTLTASKPSDDSAFNTYTVTVDAAADPITGVS